MHKAVENVLIRTLCKAEQSIFYARYITVLLVCGRRSLPFEIHIQSASRKTICSAMHGIRTDTWKYSELFFLPQMITMPRLNSAERKTGEISAIWLFSKVKTLTLLHSSVLVKMGTTEERSWLTTRALASGLNDRSMGAKKGPPRPSLT